MTTIHLPPSPVDDKPSPPEGVEAEVLYEDFVEYMSNKLSPSVSNAIMLADKPGKIPAVDADGQTDPMTARASTVASQHAAKTLQGPNGGSRGVAATNDKKASSSAMPPAVMSEMTYPGASAFTRMPLSAYSKAIVVVIWWTAAFEVL